MWQQSCLTTLARQLIPRVLPCKERATSNVVSRLEGPTCMCDIAYGKP